MICLEKLKFYVLYKFWEILIIYHTSHDRNENIFDKKGQTKTDFINFLKTKKKHIILD